MVTRSGDDRLIPLEGCFNFRDLGGYPAADGRTIRWRRLFRADGLTRLTEPDLAALAGFGLASVVALRTHGELSKRGPIPWPDSQLSLHHLPMTDVLPDREQFPQWVDSAYVAERYLEM